MSEQTTETTTVATETAPQTPKTSKPRKVAKKAAKPAPKASTNGDLTGSELKVLTVLAKAGKPLTRKDLTTKTGIKKGWSKLLGSPTKKVSKESLEGRGYVKSSGAEAEEMGRTLIYSVTAAGRKAVAK